MAITKEAVTGNHKIAHDPLVKLHGEIAKVLSKALKKEIVDHKCIELAIKFLDNNGISAPPIENKENSSRTLAETMGDLAKLSERFVEEDKILPELAEAM